MSSFLNKIKGQSGLTLMELIVALALTGILLVFIIAGNIYFQGTLINWSSSSRLYEERAYILKEIKKSIQDCDSLYLHSGQFHTVFYTTQDSLELWLSGDTLYADGRILNRPEISVDRIVIEKDYFTIPDQSNILPSEDTTVQFSGLYLVELELSYKGKKDVSRACIRNFKAFTKH